MTCRSILNGPLRHAAQGRSPFVWKTRKLQGEFKWNGSSRWKFSGKKVIPFEVKYFCRFYRNDRIFLYHLFGLLVPVFTQRKRKLYRYFVNGTTQFRSCFRCQKNTSTIWRKFSTEIFVQMVSAPDHQCEIASCDVRSTCSPVISLHLSYISYR